MFRILFLFFILSPTCFAGTRDSKVLDEKYLEYGEKYECVVKIHAMCNCGKKHISIGSAVVLNKNWIITAAHVVHNKSNIKINIKEEEFEIKNIIIHEKYSDKSIGSFDIALCKSEKDLNINFYPELYENKDELSKFSSICGYGWTGTFDEGANNYDGKKRAGYNVISSIENDNVLIFSLTKFRKTKMDFIIAPGDSGGGVFIDKKLAGINSFIRSTSLNTKANSGNNNESGHIRISAFSKWIKEHVN